MSSVVERSLLDLSRGRPILVYDADGREGETDIVVPSEFVTAATIRTLRKEAGGFICATVPHQLARRLGLPLIEEALDRLKGHYPVFQKLVSGSPPYDSRSSFSVTVNHRRTYTGVTDRDRALTISSLARVFREVADYSESWAQQVFSSEFRSPGHVPLLITDDPLLEGRRGHTELGTALAIMAGVTPTVTLCEMMGDREGALSKEGAKKYARDRNLVFTEGREIVEAWRRWSGSWLQESLISST